MTLFDNAAEFEEMISGFFRYVADDSEIREKLLTSGIVIRFNYEDPDAIVTVDCSGNEVEVRPGDKESHAQVEMSMKAELAHRFWLGKVNLTKALARREIMARGPIPTILKLLPAIRPAYSVYPKYLEENGYGQHLIP
jgi:hypothetical protein